jgi:hypothetical protein
MVFAGELLLNRLRLLEIERIIHCHRHLFYNLLEKRKICWLVCSLPDPALNKVIAPYGRYSAAKSSMI